MSYSDNPVRPHRGILRCRSERCSPNRHSEVKNKKNVRFREYVDLEEFEISSKATTSKEDFRSSRSIRLNHNEEDSSSDLHLIKDFWLPNIHELQWLTACQKVHLESVRWFGRAITGVVRVANLSFEKKIEIKYSFDGWNTMFSNKASYSGSPLPTQDQFSFCIFLPFLDVDMEVVFCIHFESNGQSYWDSNGGHNYRFTCVKSTFNDNPLFHTDCSIFF
ncbi:hypothetical protein AB6A40_000726 [Gnathostoma spinigerum]|uniref:CBM21 domain-containing protein n=1 Tax=Gnathostoma spinigerum TaxID=75299 RepID=A0ABD6EBZ6_9BILA